MCRLPLWRQRRARCWRTATKVDLVEAGEAGADLAMLAAVIVVSHRQGNHEPASKDGHKDRNGPDRVSHWVVLLMKEALGGHTVKTQHSLSGVVTGDALDHVYLPLAT